MKKRTKSEVTTVAIKSSIKKLIKEKNLNLSMFMNLMLSGYFENEIACPCCGKKRSV